MAQRLGVARAEVSAHSGSALREARIDLNAVAANLAILWCNSAHNEVDLAADAYGHGAAAVAAVAVAAGAHSLIVRSEVEAASLRVTGVTVPITVTDEIGSDAAAAVFGLGPLAQQLGLFPVMRVSAPVMSIKSIAAGEPVSYGYTWRSTTRSTLALVPLGYADGILRAASNLGELWLRGALRPIVGRVAMDVIVLDLGAATADVGDEVVLFGDPDVPTVTADRWAAALGIPALEVTTGVGARVTRRWIS